MFFLEKSLNDLVENGELIFIIPAGVFTTSSSAKLNEIIFNNYSITYFELIPENVWENAAVPTAIIKIIKTKIIKIKSIIFFQMEKLFLEANQI